MKKRVSRKRSKTSENSSCNNTKEDIISSLPEPILHHIISFLPTKDAVKTSALSRTWNSAWKSSPVMVFDQYSFLDSAYSRNRHKNIKNSVRDFCRHVNGSITLRKGAGEATPGIKKFKVVVNSYGSSPARRRHLDEWLDFAITDNNLRDLVLANYYNSTKEGWHYVLPLSLFRALSSLKTLDLFGCRFIEQSRLSDYYNGINGIVSLKKLRLSHVYIDQETLESVVSRCGLLEELSLVSCKGFEVVRVSNCPKLEVVDLYLSRVSEVQVVAVLASNLLSISYGGGIASVWGSLMASEFHESLKELKLHDTDITDEFFRVMFPKLFGQIEKVEISRCCLLESVWISSDRLLELAITECVKLRGVELDTCHHLSRFRTDNGCDVRLQRNSS